MPIVHSKMPAAKCCNAPAKVSGTHMRRPAIVDSSIKHAGREASFIATMGDMFKFLKGCDGNG